MPYGFREILQFYLIDCRTALGKAIDIVIVFLNLVICAILVIETYSVSEATSRLLWRSEMIIVLFFIIEYAARLYAAKNRFKQPEMFFFMNTTEIKVHLRPPLEERTWKLNYFELVSQ